MFVVLAVFIVAVSYLLVLFLRSVKEQCRVVDLMKTIPGPKQLPVVGNALEFSTTLDILPALMRLQKAHGPTFKVLMGPFNNYVFSSDPDLLELILTSNDLISKSRDYSFFERWLGNGLLTTSKKDRWRVHRKILTPTFHFKILEEFVPIFDDNVHTLCRILGDNEGKAIDFYEYAILCTLDIISETAMGIKLDNQNKRNNNDYVESLRYMGKVMSERTFSPWKQFDLLYNLSPAYRKELKTVKDLHGLTKSVIKLRKEELKKMERHEKNVEENVENEEGDFYGKKKMAFLDLLLNSDMNDEEIREEVDTFMFAGHDTVTSAISFAVYNLSRHPEVQRKLQQEIDGLNCKGTLTYEILQSMKYTEMVIKESLRMHAAVQLYARNLTSDVHYKNYVIPKGVRLVINAFGTHRNPEVYENPDDFDPERFGEKKHARSPFSFIPFSAGPRNCIGQKFAMLELKTILYRIIEKFEVLPVEGHELVLASETVLKSDNGVYVIFKKRVLS